MAQWGGPPTPAPTLAESSPARAVAALIGELS